MTNMLMYIAAGIISACTLTALLASIADIYTQRKYRASSSPRLAKSSQRSANIVTILLFHTSLPATLSTLRSLKKTRHLIPSVVIVSSNPAQHDLPGLRKHLKRRKGLTIRLYGSRLVTGREQALRKAYRHISRGNPVLVIDGGDIVTPQTLQATIHLAKSRNFNRIHLAHQVFSGSSLYEHTTALITVAAQLIERIHQLLPYSPHYLPSGTLLLHPKKDTPHGIYLSKLTVSGAGLLPTKHFVTMYYLLATGLVLLGMLLYAALQAAFLQTTLPLLLFLFVVAFATFVTISWSQTMRPKDKWQLYTFAPISGVVLPIGLTILASYELSVRSFRTLKGLHIRRNTNRNRNQRNILNNILPLKTRH